MEPVFWRGHGLSRRLVPLRSYPRRVSLWLCVSMSGFSHSGREDGLCSECPDFLESLSGSWKKPHKAMAPGHSGEDRSRADHHLVVTLGTPINQRHHLQPAAGWLCWTFLPAKREFFPPHCHRVFTHRGSYNCYFFCTTVGSVNKNKL